MFNTQQNKYSQININPARTDNQEEICKLVELLRKRQLEERQLKHRLDYNCPDAVSYFPTFYNFLISLENQGLAMNTDRCTYSKFLGTSTAIQNQFQIDYTGIPICMAVLNNMSEEDIHKMADELIQLKSNMNFKELMQNQLKDIQKEIREIKHKLDIK